jgi:hypothetical protein
MNGRFSSLVTLGVTLTLGVASVATGCGDSKANGVADAGRGGDSGQAGGGSAGRAGNAGRGGSAGRGGDSGASASGGVAATSGGGAENRAGSAGSGRGGGANSSSGGTANSHRGGGTGMAGEAGVSGAAGTNEGGAGASGGDSTPGSGGTATCSVRQLTPKASTPTVELLVDTSSSMFDTTPAAATSWSVLYDALMNPNTGVVKPLAAKIRFGFLSYKGHQGASETDPACATMTAVPPALDNYQAIDTVYTAVGATFDPAHPPQPYWETPTNYAIGYAANLLVADTFDGPKYILLVTDGNPNTCVTLDPQCGQDRALKATQDAYQAGVGLLALGVGDIVSNPNSGCPSSERCGLLHLQDLANAGVGAPVTTPNHCDDPTSDTCQARYLTCNNGTLEAAYTPGAPDVGTPFAVDTTGSSAESELTSALSSLLSGVSSCSIGFDSPITADASHVVVKVGNSVRAYGDDNGWQLSTDRRQVTLEGSACTDFRNGASVEVSEPCE